MMSWRLTECSLEQADYGTYSLHSEEHGTRGALDVSYSYLPHVVFSLLLLAFRNEPSWVGSQVLIDFFRISFSLGCWREAAALLSSIYPMRKTASGLLV